MLFMKIFSMKKKYKIFSNNIIINSTLLFKKIFSTNIGYSIRKWFFNVKQIINKLYKYPTREICPLFFHIQYPHPDYLLYIRRFVFEKTINK